MDKEFILNENTKSLVFVKDTEPAQVYLNGTLVEGMSAIKSNVQGTTEVTYNSEYKQNLMNMSVEGNTFQQTYSGKNLIDVEKLAELIISYKGIYVGEIVEVEGRRCVRFYNGTLHGKDFTACCPTFKANTRYIFSFEARPYSIMPEDSQYNGGLSMGFKPSGISPSKQLNAKTTTEFTRIFNVNNANTTVSDINISFGSVHYWLIDLDSVYLYEYDGNNNPEYEPYVGRIPSPNVDCPQPIQNSSNVEVELRGDNVLISPSDFADTIDLGNYVKYDISTQVYDINLVKFGTSKSICHFDTPIPAGTKYTLLADVVNNDFEINYTLSLGLYKKDDTGTAWAGSTLDLSTLSQSNKIIYKTGVTTQPTTDIWLFKNYSENSYVKNLKVRFLVYFGEQTVTEWQPYFEPVNVTIPLSLNKMGDKTDKLTFDKLNQEVVVNRQVWYRDLSNVAWAEMYNTGNNTYFNFKSTKYFSNRQAYCNRAIVNYGNLSNLDDLADGEFKVFFDVNTVYLAFASSFDLRKDSNTNLSDVNKLLAWLETNPTEIAIPFMTGDSETETYKDEQWVQDLLTFAKSTQNATNTITVNSTLPISKLDVGYAIWGGRDES